jgi:hypothetical protein
VTRKDIDDAAMADALLDQIADPIASFTADGGYDDDQVAMRLPTSSRRCRHCAAAGNRGPECFDGDHPDTARIMPISLK